MIQLYVDVEKYVANIEKIKSTLKNGTKYCAVVKANAYGLGYKEISEATQNNVDCFAVAFSFEGLAMREEGIKKPILQLSPYESEYLQDSINQEIMLSTFSLSQLEEIEKTAKSVGKSAVVQIKINSGMNRYGVKDSGYLNDMLNKINSSKNLSLAGVFSHLSGRDEEFAYVQKSNFEKLTNHINTHKHISASYGTRLSQDFHMNMVRVGIDAIGTGEDDYTKQTVALKSEIVAFQSVEAGEYIGYGDYFKANEKINVAIVRGGYADGVNRLLRNGGCVIINGNACKVRGTICMDCFMVDVSNADCKIGDSVEIFSENMPLATYANTIQTIPYEAVTQISQRVKRVYL
ncbi:MAG: alanine racemase [Bacillota bacterium]